MAKQSRTESQQETRRRLVTTAKRLFLEKGYGGTSLEAVAQAAGYSKGAVYSNFESKDALCQAVLEAYREGEREEIVRAFSEGASFEERVEAFARWAERTIGDPGWTVLEVEFALHARHDRKLRKALEVARRGETEAFALLCELQAREFGLELRLPPRVTASALLSLGIGLGVQRVFDRSVPVEALVETLRLFFYEPPHKRGARRER